jgi:hypothetical protein
MWENNRDHLTRLMVRARVSDLQDAPYFIVVIEAEGFQSESWTVQVEIVEQEMLGVLPVDEEPAPQPQVHDNPLPFDFFGLGQQGGAPQQQNNQLGGLNAFGEQIGQNQMDFDLNIEDVVEGDDQDLEVFQEMLEAEGVHEQDEAVPIKQAIEIDLNAPPSLDPEPSMEESGSDGCMLDKSDTTEEEGQIVLALQAEPVDFSVEEIQQHELLSANPSDTSGSSGASQSASEDRGVAHMQVGMVLLPDSLDVDPWLMSLAMKRPSSSLSADTVRLWARFFAPPGSSSGTLIPSIWQDFFMLSLLNPVSFDWAKSFLSSDA